MLRTQAATNNVSFESEAGTVSGTAASAGVIAGSSGGSAVTLAKPTPVSDERIIRSLAYHPKTDVPMELFDEARLQAIGFNAEWHQYQPNTKHVFDESYKVWTDNFLNQMKARNVKVFAAVLSSPGWANGGQGKNSRNFSNEDYCDYLKDLNDRWGDRLEGYGIWNEPGLDGFMEGSQEQKADRYASLLKSAYTCLRELDPTKLVITGGLYQPVWNNPQFLEMLYARGIKGHYDVFNQHMYGDTSGHASGYGLSVNQVPYKTMFDAIKTNILSIMIRNGDGDKPIWITETGVNTASNTEQQQAEQLNIAYDLLKENYLPNVKRLYWYQVAEGCDSSPGYESRLALLCRNSNGTWRKKPAFDVFKSK